MPTSLRTVVVLVLDRDPHGPAALEERRELGLEIPAGTLQARVLACVGLRFHGF